MLIPLLRPVFVSRVKCYFSTLRVSRRHIKDVDSYNAILTIFELEKKTKSEHIKANKNYALVYSSRILLGSHFYHLLLFLKNLFIIVIVIKTDWALRTAPSIAIVQYRNAPLLPTFYLQGRVTNQKATCY